VLYLEIDQRTQNGEHDCGGQDALLIHSAG
jgi:hypothetical protein